jgi:hypothetical protein
VFVCLEIETELAFETLFFFEKLDTGRSPVKKIESVKFSMLFLVFCPHFAMKVLVWLPLEWLRVIRFVAVEFGAYVPI